MCEWLRALLPWAEVVLLLGYVGLFLARKDSSLRLRTVAVIQCVGLAAQVAALAAQWPSHTSFAVMALLSRSVIVAVLFTVRGVLLVRARAGEVRAELDEGCRRLFIAKEERRRGELYLSARGIAVVVRLWAMGPCTLILFPRPPGPGKLTLFFDWLSKRYPGPIPRIRVSLNRR